MSTQQNTLEASVAKATQQWLDQDGWGTPANKDLMRAIIAQDPEAARKALVDGAQIDFTPPSSKQFRDHWGSAVGVEPKSPWLAYTLPDGRYDSKCEQPDRVGVMAALMEYGANPLETLPGEDGDVFVLCAMMYHASPDLVATLARFEPRLSATWPVSAIEPGAGPLAHALLSRFEIPIFGNASNGERPHSAREQAAVDLLELGSQWDPFTRGEVLSAAAGSSSVDVLDLLSRHGCRVADMTEAERVTVQDTIDLMSGVYSSQSARWAEWIQAVNPEQSPNNRRRPSP